MDYAAALPGFAPFPASGAATSFPSGTRMFVWHPLHRTVFPRADVGTARIFLHVKFGHIIRIVSGWVIAALHPEHRPVPVPS